MDRSIILPISITTLSYNVSCSIISIARQQVMYGFYYVQWSSYGTNYDNICEHFVYNVCYINTFAQ